MQALSLNQDIADYHLTTLGLVIWKRWMVQLISPSLYSIDYNSQTLYNVVLFVGLILNSDLEVRISSSDKELLSFGAFI